MKKPEIFHTIKSTGQTFTSQEWGEWCRQHRGGNPIVFTYKEFSFNDCDVCVTPHTKIDWKGKGCSLTVTTAESPCGRWDYGISYSVNLGGGGRAPQFIGNTLSGYTSEKEAVIAAVSFYEEHLNREAKILRGLSDDSGAHEGEEKPSARLDVIKDALTQVRIWKDMFDPRQLELFG